jgi:hypothetical protein
MGRRIYEIEDLVRWVHEIRDDRRTRLLPFELAINLQCLCRQKMNMEGLKFWSAVADHLQQTSTVQAPDQTTKNDRAISEIKRF